MTKEQAYELVDDFATSMYNRSQKVAKDLLEELIDEQDKPLLEKYVEKDGYNLDQLINALETIRKGLGIKEDAND